MSLFTNNIIYTDNVFVQINKSNESEGINYHISQITEGLRLLEISMGYMEILNLRDILKNLGLKEKVIFYGVEEINTESFIWKIFAIIKKISPNFVSFYDMPHNKVHGVVTKIEIP